MWEFAEVVLALRFFVPACHRVPRGYQDIYSAQPTFVSRLASFQSADLLIARATPQCPPRDGGLQA